MPGSAIGYQVQIEDLHAHLFAVTLTIAQPAQLQRVSLPVWIPGSYLVREFSRNLQRLQAHQGRNAVALTQLDKCSWQVHCAAGKALVLSYQIYAFDRSVRTAWLDAARGFFNGTSMFLRVQGQEDMAHTLELVADKALSDWQVATGLPSAKTTADGFGIYLAADYDELVDSPVEMGRFWSGSFVACGVPHRFVVAGAPPGFDGKRLLNDSQRICEAAIRFWHGPRVGSSARNKAPHKNYLFMLSAEHDGYGGLEHRNSTALICKRGDLPRLANPALTPLQSPSAEVDAGRAENADGYSDLLGLISHEYFHTWNVKRLRPAEFTTYDYSNENYTQLLWFFEGFTSYYDDLLLCRAGLIGPAVYLERLGKTINQMLQAPGRGVQSVAQSSFDAWVKYYRQDENTPNATISYYTKGSLVALCLDLTLRQEASSTLDAVMRALWQRCRGGPMREADLSTVLTEIAGPLLGRKLSDWVHTTADLPLKTLLQRQGVSVQHKPAGIAQRLGLRVLESDGIQIKGVLRGGAAEQAGFAAGDEWLGIETGKAEACSSWRLAKLDDLLLYAGTETKIGALVARDRRIWKLVLTLPKAAFNWSLAVSDKKLVARWLD
ncbi:MAG: M61 family metallopeptidase [Rhodoferax sp.]